MIHYNIINIEFKKKIPSLYNIVLRIYISMIYSKQITLFFRKAINKSSPSTSGAVAPYSAGYQLTSPPSD